MKFNLIQKKTEKNNFKRILFLIALIPLICVFLYLLKSTNPEYSKFFPKCFLYKFTGIQCPGCGTGRAIYNLLNGNIKTAFLYNPLLFLAIPTLIILFCSKKMRLNHIFSKWVAIVVILYMILRNIFPITIA